MSKLYSVIKKELYTDPERQTPFVVASTFCSIGETIDANGNPVDVTLNANVIAAFEWDEISPFAILRKGTFSDFGIYTFAGVPLLTKQEYYAKGAIL